MQENGANEQPPKTLKRSKSLGKRRKVKRLVRKSSFPATNPQQSERQLSKDPPSKHLIVGDRCVICLDENHVGTVRYIGPVSFRGFDLGPDALFYGVELDKPKGTHDGMVQGKRYFTCPPGKGVYVAAAANRVFPYTQAYDPGVSIAKSRIAALVEGARARLAAKQQLMGITYKALDEDLEASQRSRDNRLQMAGFNMIMKPFIEASTPSSAALPDVLGLMDEKREPTGFSASRNAAVQGDGTVNTSYRPLPPTRLTPLSTDVLGPTTPRTPRHEEDVGLRLKFPLDYAGVERLVEYFRSGQTLHHTYVERILRLFSQTCGRENTLREVVIQEGEKLTVVGDTHGQLPDLISIWHVQGLPTPKNRYLFNGVSVRSLCKTTEGVKGNTIVVHCRILLTEGIRGVEIFVLLAAYYLVDPSAVLLNRGNHEDDSQNTRNGFRQEVLQKYQGTADDPGRGLRLYAHFQNAFQQLPLATVISAAKPKAPNTTPPRVFVVHGGLSGHHGVHLDHINAIERKRAVPWKGPRLEDSLFEHLMWSDPAEHVGEWKPNLDRNAGVLWGPKLSEHFCQLNDVHRIIRSHEMKQKGYEMAHDGRVVTLFSASRYVGECTNSGAFMTFDHDMKYTIRVFKAGKLKSLRPKYVNPEELPSTITEPSTPRLSKPTSVPEESKGQDLCAVYGFMSTKIGFSAEEMSVVDHVIDLDPETSKASHHKQHQAVRNMIIEKVCHSKPDLLWYFTQLDKSHTGKITKLQWAQGMETVLGIPGVKWLLLAPHFVSFEDDGRIVYSKFLESYNIKLATANAEWQTFVIRDIQRRISSTFRSLKDAYEAFDIDKDSLLTVQEFAAGLAKLDLGLSKEQVYELLMATDTDKDGHISFREFEQRFRWVYRGNTTPEAKEDGAAVKPSRRGSLRPSEGQMRRVAEDKAEKLRGILDRIGEAIWQISSAKEVDGFAKLFAELDKEGTGVLSMADFVDALLSLNTTPALSKEEAILAAHHIDADRSGTIDYNEFAGAFEYELPADAEGGWEQSALQQIIAFLHEYRHELTSAFELMDSDGDGFITPSEFKVGLRALAGVSGSTLSDAAIEGLLHSLDENKDGKLDIKEFSQAFSITDTSGTSPAQ